MVRKNFFITSQQFTYMFLFLLLLLVFSIIAIKVVNQAEYPNRDFFTFWLSGRLALLGQNPYDSAIWIAGHHQFGVSWIPNATFIYPMPLSFLFIPLGILPLYDAFVVWEILSQIMVLASVILLLRINPSLLTRYFVPLAAGVALFRPTILFLINGQISGLLLLIICIVIYLWEKENWWQGTAILALLVLKPNLGIPIILLLSMYLIRQRKIEALIAGMVSGLVLLIIGWLQNPNWVAEFWNAGNTKLSQTFGISPTVWGISTFFCDFASNCTIGYGMLVSLLFIAGYLYLLVKKQDKLSPSLIVGLAVTITLLLTPYTWAYDQVLLVAPIVTTVMLLAKKGYRYLPVSMLFVVIDVFAFLLLGLAVQIQLDIWSVSIPLFVFFLLVWCLSKSKTSMPSVEMG